MLDLCWILAIVLFATEVLIPQTFVSVFERGKSPVEVFALRGRSFPYVAIWTVVAIVAIVLAGVDGVEECIEVTTAVFAAFIPVFSWRVYFENYDFVEQFVKENKERMTTLLLYGMGVGEQTFEAVSSAVETALVDFFTKKLTEKRWTILSRGEIGRLMFDSGIETAKVIAEKLKNEAYWTIFAFLTERRTCLERILVPMRAKEALEGQAPEKQILNCIAIILANETEDGRDDRARQFGKVHGPYYPTAVIAAQKTAIETILSWPVCLQRTLDIKIRQIDFDTEKLCLISEDRRCCEKEIPPCVRYTLTEMIEAGYIRFSPNRKTHVCVSFRDQLAVFEKKDWDRKSTIGLKPFRYVTAMKCLNEDPAFVIEQSEVINGVGVRNGSCAIEGTLRVAAVVEARETGTWLHDADVRNDDDGIWGELENFVKPMHGARMCRLIADTVGTTHAIVSQLKGKVQPRRNSEDVSSPSSAV